MVTSLEKENSTFQRHDEEVLDSNNVALESLVPIWCKNVLITFIAIAIVLGIPGNSLVLVVLLKIKRKTSTDMFVIFIAFCDIISLAFNGTVYIWTFTSGLSDSLSSQYLCKVHIYIVHFVFLQSTFLITCVGIDRYFKTCRPHSILFTAKSSFRCCIILNVISALFNISHMFTTRLNEDGKCILDNSMATLRLTMYATLFIIVICCSVALCVMYIKIAIQIRRRVRVSPALASYTQTHRDHNHHNPGPQVQDAERMRETQLHMDKMSRKVNKTTTVTAAITCVFIVSTVIPSLSVAILTGLSQVKNHEVGRIIVFFVLRIYIVNNFANPIFFTWLSSEFRKKVKSIFGVCKC